MDHKYLTSDLTDCKSKEYYRGMTLWENKLYEDVDCTLTGCCVVGFDYVGFESTKVKFDQPQRFNGTLLKEDAAFLCFGPVCSLNM